MAKLRQIPWQTPHTFREDGELNLTEAGKKWLDQASRRREQLADEARAEAGMSDFGVSAAVRERMKEAQQRDTQALSYVEEPWGRLADDGLVEVLVPGLAGKEV